MVCKLAYNAHWVNRLTVLPLPKIRVLDIFSLATKKKNWFIFIFYLLETGNWNGYSDSESNPITKKSKIEEMVYLYFQLIG